MRAFLISLLLHLTFFLFITYSFKEPSETVQGSFLGVNVVSFSETPSSPGNLSPESEEKKPDFPLEKKKEEIKKEIVIEKKAPKKIVPSKVEKTIPSPSDEKIDSTSEDETAEKSEESQTSQESEPSGSVSGTQSSSDSENFISDGSGGKIATNQNIDGLSYQLLKAPNPSYPIQAKRVRISEEVIIKTRFLVGLNGKVEKIEILEGTENFGFRNEVKKALKQWQFSPVEYKGKKIKIYFYKDFIFNLKK